MYLPTLVSPDIDAEFEEFAVDAGSAPARVFSA
jgi:hypothetical protein